MTARLRRDRPLLRFAALVVAYGLCVAGEIASIPFLAFVRPPDDLSWPQKAGVVLLSASYFGGAQVARRLPSAYLRWRARRRPTPVPDYRRARGAFNWQLGDEPAEVTVRRIRGGNQPPPTVQLQPGHGVYRYDFETGAWVRLAACERAGEGEDE